MDHPTLTHCLAVLGLSACSTPMPAMAGPHGVEPHTAEPSGLGMQPHAPTRASESGPRFVSEQNYWCEVSIDTHARELEPTPSFLRAWNLVAANGRRPSRHVNTPPHTEDDARVRICGRADCTVEQPQIFQAMTVGGAPAGTAREGFGVILPSEHGPLVVPVEGIGGVCAVAPELRVEQVGSLVHVTALVHEGSYARTYYHGYGDYNGHGGPSYGGCQTLATARTDIVVDVATGELELRLIQVAPREPASGPLVEARLDARGVELHGCADVLELAWTK